MMISVMPIRVVSLASSRDDIRPERLHPDDPPVNPAYVDPKTLPKVTHGAGQQQPETIGFPNRRLPRPIVENVGPFAPGGDTGDTIGVIVDEFSGALAMDMTDGVVTWSKLPGRVAVLTGATITHGDGRETRIVPDAQPSPELDVGINGWLDGNGDMSDVGKVATMFGTPTHCPGAAVLMWGCTPQRYTPRVYTFSTDVDAIQRQQLMIGACLVAPAVAMHAVAAGITATTSVGEGIATLLQWVRPLAPAF